MFLLLPIRTDSPIKRTPYVNYGLIAANILIYLWLDVLGRSLLHWGRMVKDPLMLWPVDLRVHQFLTYQFLHADKFHLLGNMFFLWIFGNSVNAKMGNLTYGLFYLACGVFAGLGFALGDSAAPCLGASGSIAGITTAYLVLFPRSEVTVLYWIFISIGTVPISSLVWIIGKMIVWDNYLAMEHVQREFTSVAYEAHLAGYLFGFILAAAMLAIRALPRDQYDILALARRWYQRKSFAAAMRDPGARAQAQYGRVARPVRDEIPVEAAPANDAVWPLRAAIAGALANSDFTGATRQYEELIAQSPTEVLSRPNQLTVANQLMSIGRHASAAEAYEKFLKHYSAATERTQVRLILGILYARYLGRFDLARTHLSQALESLHDPAQREQAEHYLQLASASAPPSNPPPGAQPAT